MNCLEIFMGQGVIADMAQTWVSTGGIYTCAAILMINRQGTVAGLFHYPSGAMLKDGKAKNEAQVILHYMVKKLGLTSKNARILIQQGAGGLVNDDDSANEDIIAMGEFFGRYGLETQTLDKGGYIRLGMEGKKMKYQTKELMARSLSDVNGGYRGKEMSYFNDVDVIVFGRDMHKDEPEVKVKEKASAFSFLKKKKKDDDDDDNDDLMRGVKDVETYWATCKSAM